MRTLAGEHAGFVAVRDALVLAEQVADFACAHADVAGRHVGVLADVVVERGHEALAEPHDFAVAATLGIEVRAALGAADRQARERILEDLFESQEFDDAQIHRRVKSQAPLIGTQCAVEANAKAAVDLHHTVVVLPGHTKDELTLRLADALDDLLIGVFGMLGQHRPQTVQNFANGLMELGLARIALNDLAVDVLDTFARGHHLLPHSARDVASAVRRRTGTATIARLAALGQPCALRFSIRDIP